MRAYKKYLLFFLLFFLYMLFLWNEYGHTFTKNRWVHEDGSIETFFCPQDNCEQIWIEQSRQAKDIQCAFYELKLENLSRALKNADIVLHEEGRWGLMHNKFCVFDKQIVITGSMNPTYNGAYKNDNNLVRIKSELLAQNYLEEFYELKDIQERPTSFPKVNLSGILIENYFCPEDTCEQQILEELRNAKQEVLFMTFSFTSDAIGDVLVQKLEENISVQGIFETRMKNTWWEFDKLKDAGADVTLDSNPQTMHHKVFIIDEQTVITGSMNPTNNGNKNNDENMLIIHDKKIAKQFKNEFISLK